MSEPKHSAVGVSWDALREMIFALPEVEEGVFQGTPSFKVKGKFLGRIREDGDTFVIKMDEFEKEARLALEPDIFYTTDHYNGYPAILVRLSKIHPDALRQIIEKGWRMVAPKRMLKAYDEANAVGENK